MTAMTINFSFRWICVEYYLLRVQGIAKLLDQLDLIGHTSELARLFGIQFLEVLSRGSQVCKFHITYCHRLAHVGVRMYGGEWMLNTYHSDVQKQTKNAERSVCM